MSEHLIVEKGEKYIKVTCSEGHYITKWNKENVLDFSYAKIMYCPLTIDLSVYYCLTDEEIERYNEEQRIAVEELEKINK